MGGVGGGGEGEISSLFNEMQVFSITIFTKNDSSFYKVSECLRPIITTEC